MSRRALLLAALALLVLGCNAPLAACPKGQSRGWCLVEIADRGTWAEVQAMCAPTRVQTPVTVCLQGSASQDLMFGLIERMTKWMDAFYGRSSFPPYVEKGGHVFTADFAKDTQKRVLCQFAETNPYADQNHGAYVNLDASALRPKIEPATIGGGGGSATDDCGACLAGACPMAVDDADIAACIHDHCAAVCPAAGACSSAVPPDGCAGNGATCGPAVCCPGLYCYAGPAASVCM